ncbi:GrpB family protein [Shewanella sp. KCT]|uniref:GrpB family protein n=1 Tax=Shewanella sp. KCT TaxID=2569535 RepID=UPI0011829D06|nr:GrpB family protein [Shewanella sp. KCT]TVP09288.1 hypothetical protein AYI87_20090 [Shewanella sp. KCT]
MKFYSPEEYQSSCEELFFWYKSQIEKLVNGALVEHIGASSIPKAISKGDLDIFVGVPNIELESTVRVLKKLGFQEKADTLRTSELCMLESTSDNDVALQVVANGSEFECFLEFRDKLRANEMLVQRYNELKMSCEGLPQEEYRKMKSFFVEYVLAKT